MEVWKSEFVFPLQRPSGDELKDFFRNLQRHMKRKKKTPSASEVLQEHAPHVIGDQGPISAPPQGAIAEDIQRSPAAKQKHSTRVG